MYTNPHSKNPGSAPEDPGRLASCKAIWIERTLFLLTQLIMKRLLEISHKVTQYNK